MTPTLGARRAADRMIKFMDTRLKNAPTPKRVKRPELIRIHLAEVIDHESMVGELLMAANQLLSTKPTYSIEYGKSEEQLRAVIAKAEG